MSSGISSGWETISEIIAGYPYLPWLNADPEKLSGNILKACENPANELYLSLVTPWEIQIKQQLGKLKLHRSLSTLIKTQIEQNGLMILPIKIEHILALENLPALHKDPFDRLLIAQADVESMSFVTVDQKIEQYSIKTLH